MAYQYDESLNDWLRDGWLNTATPDGVMPLSFDDFARQELARYNLAPGTDKAAARVNYTAGDMDRNISIGMPGQVPAYTNSWEDDKSLYAPYLAMLAFGGSALAAGAGAGAGAAAGAGAGGGAGGAAGGLGAIGAEGIGGAIMSGAGGAAGAGAGAGLGTMGAGSMATSVLPAVTVVGKAAAPSILPGLLGSAGALGGAAALSQVPAAFEPVDIPDYNPEPLQQVPNFELPNVPAPAGGLGQSSWLDSIKNTAKPIADAVKPVSDLVGGGSNLAGLIGGIAGATQGGKTETSSRDPWSAAQPYLKNLLADADAMRAGLKDQPFTPQQTQQYQQAFAGLDQARGAIPGLLNWGQQAMQRQPTTPSYQQLFGGGLLPQQPTAQAGGPGGLLGDSQEDRMKALMARGRGLMG